MAQIFQRSHSKRSDTELVESCLAGDAEAWKALIARYQAFLMRIPLRYGLNAADADDVFQNVCLKLCLYLPKVEDPERLVGWLGAVARQECLRLLRRPSWDALNEDALQKSQVGVTFPDPEDLLLEEERIQMVRQSLSELSDDCRQLLGMLYGREPLPYEQAAESLGCPVGSIGPRRARCLERLRKKMISSE